MGNKAHTILTLIRRKRMRFQLVNRSRKVWLSDCEDATRAFIRAWNHAHGTKSLQVWDRESRALREF